jgi:hypothetical protein
MGRIAVAEPRLRCYVASNMAVRYRPRRIAGTRRLLVANAGRAKGRVVKVESSWRTPCQAR